MKLWLLRPREDRSYDRDNDPWNPWYDKNFGFVIRAKTEKDARQIANEQNGRETKAKTAELRWQSGNKEAWLNSKYSTCEELLPAGDSEVIIRDFAAA